MKLEGISRKIEVVSEEFGAVSFFLKIRLRKGGSMSEDKYKMLKIENQLCFPLYAAAKELVKRYKPFLDPLDLTYTQYIAMMVLWDVKETNSKELGRKLYLDSGTLTPLLKKLEMKGLIERARSEQDERNLNVKVTEKGMALREEALKVPGKVAPQIRIEIEEARVLYKTLYEMLEGFSR